MARRQFSIKISVFFTSKKKKLEGAEELFDIPKPKTVTTNYQLPTANYQLVKKTGRKLQLPATLGPQTSEE